MSLQFETSATDTSNWIGSLTYQSTASSIPSASDLQDLAAKARARNRSAGVTGMLLYENGRFLQTLEGPPAGLDSVWASIRRDERHKQIDILSQHIVSARLFSDWDLLIYSRMGDTSRVKRSPTTEHGLVLHLPNLINLALDGDDIGLNALMASLAEQGWDGETILMYLVEPAARALGDAWLCDDCTELDLTIGLSMLQLAGHAVRHSPTPEAMRNSRYSILLATAPGEPHMLGSSLLADVLTDAGWQVDMAFPGSNEALVNQLGAQQPDAIDIALSDALPRHHTIAKLRETISKSRAAAPDHWTVVSVGGRLFAEAAATAASVGADHARTSVAGSSVRLAELIRKRRQQ